MDTLFFYSTYRQQRQNANTFRELTLKSGNPIDFSTNDYLGLSTHPDLITAAQEAASQYGVGATGSRLLSGNLDMTLNFEDRIAQDKHTEAALVLNSGYQANVSVLAALLDKAVLKQQAIVFFDKANHSSLYQGVFLSEAHLVRYPHGDLDRLKDQLETYRTDPRPKLIVSETLFGMDGDWIDLDQLATLSREFDVFLYLDEAHATGIFGPQGYGLSTTVDLRDINHLVMGTFSKGLGCFGAYVACSREIKDYLVNHCSGFIYSTALPPMVIGAAFAAWRMLPSLKVERSLLLETAEKLRSKLTTMGFDIGLSQSHIISIILGDAQSTLDAKIKLLESNVLLSAIRPPTVSPNTSRLRLALTTHHSEDQIEALLKGLATL